METLVKCGGGGGEGLRPNAWQNCLVPLVKRWVCLVKRMTLVKRWFYVTRCVCHLYDGLGTVLS